MVKYLFRFEIRISNKYHNRIANSLILNNKMYEIIVRYLAGQSLNRAISSLMMNKENDKENDKANSHINTPPLYE